jgi:hypothetical protein
MTKDEFLPFLFLPRYLPAVLRRLQDIITAFLRIHSVVSGTVSHSNFATGRGLICRFVNVVCEFIMPVMHARIILVDMHIDGDARTGTS